MKKITFEEKLKIIKEYEEGYGYNYLAKKYSLYKYTIRNWVQSYRILGEEGLRKTLQITHLWKISLDY